MLRIEVEATTMSAELDPHALGSGPAQSFRPGAAVCAIWFLSPVASIDVVTYRTQNSVIEGRNERASGFLHRQQRDAFTLCVHTIDHRKVRE